MRWSNRQKAVSGSIVVVIGLAGAALAISLTAAPGQVSHEPPARRLIAVPSAVASAAPTPVAPPPAVPSATPIRLAVPAIGIDAAVSAYTVQEAAKGFDGVTGKACLVDGIIRCVDPQSLSDVSWQVSGVGGVAFGAAPGTDTSGTVYFYGHTASGTKGVFDGLGALKPGDEATVQTTAGALRYRVQRTVDTAKSQFTSSPEAIDQVPGRLLLISCDHRPGTKLVNGGYSIGNIVVVLQLEQP